MLLLALEIDFKILNFYLFRASVVMIPKTPPLLSKQALEKKRRLKKEIEMQDTMNDIRRFEKRVLQHTEFDDDEGFDENPPGYYI